MTTPTARRHPLVRRVRLAALPALLSAALASCESSAPAGGAAAVPTVTVSTPVLAEVTDYQELTGRTEATDVVQVRARVSGYLDKISFEDGADVRQGEVLYEIDPRPYAAQLDQDRADLVNRKAVVVKTEALYRRSAALLRSNAATQEDIDTQKGDWEVAKAAVGQVEAKLRASQLNLDWTKVLAPISGRLSRTLVTKGNLVLGDSTVLTTLVSLDPIYAYFDVDEQTMLRVHQTMREGKYTSARDRARDPFLTAASVAAMLASPLPGRSLFAAGSLYPGKTYTVIPLRLRLANEDRFTHEGRIDFVNNRVENSTGTLQIRGVFPNPKPPVGERPLLPGMFVRVRVPTSRAHPALLVSERAVAADQGLKLVFVVNAQNQVERREVTLGAQQDGLQVVEDGLKPTDRVIVSGLQRARPGTTVNPRLAEMPRPHRSTESQP